ncbi:MAG: winged helix-turn-helix domain-containing protein [Candidatus Micrarchaeia archaeon]|jgi:DNA-binding transcriptional ArsR family regulator
MQKRNLKLYFTFAVIILALAVFLSIDFLSLSIQVDEPIAQESLSIEDEFFKEEMVVGASRQINDTFETDEEPPAFFEDNILYTQIIKYISLIVIAIFLVFAGYQIFFQRVPDVLSNDLRMSMLLELREADKVPTYFSTKYDKSKSTISEHLDKLVSAGLVERVQEPGKKFVYYRITREGKNILREKKAA